MPIEIGTRMPPLDGATQWFNATAARAAAETEGHPTLVHFWSINCDACAESLRRVARWRDRHAGLRVVAVHVPHDEEGQDTEAVRMAVATHNVTEPCAVDNAHRVRQAFHIGPHDAPAYFLFDGDGVLQNFAAVEHGLDDLTPALERLLATSQKKS